MSDAITFGMVLAAGLGTRMRPLTLYTPKPLIKVAGRTMADRALDRFLEAGVQNAVLNISYLGDQIAKHFEERSDLAISLSEEDEPLETGGGVQKALPLLKGDAFFVMNGDAILLNGPTPALERLAAKWAREDEIDVLLLLLPSHKATGYEGQGDFTLSSDGIPAFRGELDTAPYVFSGTQVLSRRVFEGREMGKWSLREVYEQAIAQGRVKAIVHDGDWLHVGTPEGLDVAEDYFAKRESVDG
ncbi:putative Nucleotidyl transferase family protein Mannose-1-phosphate guanyltransferase [Candidatus Terasakiella magnetica]|uniref:Putative Nucleotidyl transferase family protein Mannose-1-phosphate guanyltransferase n=1 Tax=Candidatus Terasakiella magnetica TaxID=1867952 RepID=A0A1C3RE76_9PROT|nr:nucleotidyltransferase family protein [Candidatus Terasakiella magnetica]SCA55600.1 putative Nucleotidyl transferase family protein Mannose-1-phosphate guanyltransferase [Candidatus Terasakiella magnetica]